MVVKRRSARGETKATAVVDAATAVIATEAKARIEYCETRDPETLEERPCDVEKAKRVFLEANERWRAQSAER